jgi:hypothetical protein
MVKEQVSTMVKEQVSTMVKEQVLAELDAMHARDAAGGQLVPEANLRSQNEVNVALDYVLTMLKAKGMQGELLGDESNLLRASAVTERLQRGPGQHSEQAACTSGP